MLTARVKNFCIYVEGLRSTSYARYGDTAALTWTELATGLNYVLERLGIQRSQNRVNAANHLKLKALRGSLEKSYNALNLRFVVFKLERHWSLKTEQVFNWLFARFWTRISLLRIYDSSMAHNSNSQTTLTVLELQIRIHFARPWLNLLNTHSQV